MKLPRRNFLHLAAGAAALPTVSRIGWTEAYPSRPVRLVTGFAAAGGSDVVARLIGQWLSERFGQSFIIENRPGTGGMHAQRCATPGEYVFGHPTAASAIRQPLAARFSTMGYTSNNSARHSKSLE
jgi:tripartite-type tricarboxylate transporter receptor subunit TctC